MKRYIKGFIAFVLMMGCFINPSIVLVSATETEPRVEMPSLQRYFAMDPVLDTQSVVSGHALAGSNIEVYRDTTKLGSLIVPTSGEFRVSIPNQKMGTTLRITNTKQGYFTFNTFIIVSQIPKLEDFLYVNAINDASANLTGSTIPGSKVEVYLGTQKLGETITPASSNFSIPIPIEIGGTVLKVVNTKEGYTRYEKNIEVAILPQLRNFFTLNQVTDLSSQVSGKSKPGSNIKVFKNNVVIAQTTVNNHGDYSVEIPVQPARTQLVVQNTLTGYRGLNMTLNVVAAPNLEGTLSVNPLNDLSTTISGHGAPGSNIDVFHASSTLGHTTVQANGTYSVTIPRQATGTQLKVESSKQGYHSTSVNVSVGQAASLLNNFSINPINDLSSSVTGHATPGSLVQVLKNDVVIGNQVVPSNGVYLINIPVQNANTQITVQNTKDGCHGVSSTINVGLAPDLASSLSLNSVNDLNNVVAGSSVVGSTVEVYYNQTLLGKTTVGTNGTFSFNLPSLVGKNQLVIKNYQAGYKPTSKTVNVEKMPGLTLDVTNNTITCVQTSVTGHATPNSTVSVYRGSTRLGSTTVSNSGTYSVAIPPEPVNTVLDIEDTMANHHEVDKTIKVVDIPYLAPTLTVNEINSTSTHVTGKAVAGSTIQVYNGSRKLGQATTNQQGVYDVPIARQSVNTTLTIKDAKSGYHGASKTTKVLNYQSTFSVSSINSSSTYITGKGVSRSRVEAYVGNRRIGSSTVSSNGTYRMSIPRQIGGTKVSVRIIKSGYSTRSTTLTVPLLNLSSKFTLNGVYTSTTKVTGKAVAGSTVRVYRGSTLLGQATTNSSGNYSVTIPRQVVNTTLTVKNSKTGYAETSKAVKLLNYQNTFSVNRVTKRSTSITGKGVAGSRVEAYVGSRRIGSATVASNGTYKINIGRQRYNTSINVKITKANYASANKVVKVTN